MTSRFVPSLRRFFLRSLAVTGCLVSVLTLPTSAATNIMPLGDSITQGGINGAGAAYASYRYPLFYKLTSAGHTVDFVGTFTALHNNATANATLYPNYNTTFDKNHQADWGKKAVYLDTYITSWLNSLPAGEKPDIAIINIGTNDAAGGTPVVTFTNQINSVITKLRAANPNITIVLSNLMVMSAYQTAFTNMNNAIAGIVTAQTHRPPAWSLLTSPADCQPARVTMAFTPTPSAKSTSPRSISTRFNRSSARAPRPSPWTTRNPPTSR